MIRAFMLGRLGNNLFQYAFGRALSEKHGTRLVMDGSLFNAGDWKQVSRLKSLPLKASVGRAMSITSRAVKRLSGRHPREFMGLSVVRENVANHQFDASLLDAPSNCILAGYFQSPRYFESVDALLREELRLDLAVPSDERLRDAMDAYDSVAVHVRRTDFLTQPVFQVCGGDYYRRSMRKMRERLDRPRFFIFSDDPDWCRDHFTSSDEEVVELPNALTDPLVDLHFMSLAKHQIIANSSYSWWAAWLGRNPGQIVMTPDRWFASEIHAPIEDKLLPGWESVPTGKGESK